MRCTLALLAIVLIPVLPRIAAPAQAMNDTQMQNFMQSDYYRGLITRALAAVPKAVFEQCPSLVSKGSRTTVLRSVSFGKDGFPNEGLWKQSFPVSGCGNDTVLNFYFSAGADEKVNTTIGVPGTTRADIILQSDAIFYAQAEAALVAKDCKSFIVRDSRFEAFGTAKPPKPDPGPGNAYRPWWETWTMIGCGHTIDVSVDFMPHKNGTQVLASAPVERQ
jgi:hypothetical protein